MAKESESKKPRGSVMYKVTPLVSGEARTEQKLHHELCKVV